MSAAERQTITAPLNYGDFGRKSLWSRRRAALTTMPPGIPTVTSATSRLAMGDERARTWDARVGIVPSYAGYQASIGRNQL